MFRNLALAMQVSYLKQISPLSLLVPLYDSNDPLKPLAPAHRWQRQPHINLQANLLKVGLRLSRLQWWVLIPLLQTQLFRLQMRLR